MMRNLWMVSKHEIQTTLGKPSFWVTTVLFPLVVLGMNLGVQFASHGMFEEQEVGAAVGMLPVGFVDETGWVEAVPPEIPAGKLVRYEDPGAAQQALEAGEIDSLVTIPADYGQRGQLEITQRTFNPLGDTPEDLFYQVLLFNLAGDESLARRIAAPSAALEVQRLESKGDARDESGASPLGNLVAFATLFVFFFLITMSSGWMLRSVAKEKENRMAEVLLLSVNPREMMAGKLLGLSGVALLQMGIWVGGGVLLLGRGAQTLQAGALLQLPAAFLVLCLAYFALGYLMFGSLMGAIGALAPGVRDAGNVTFFLILPLMAPMILNVSFTTDPGGILPVALSLFPFSAPTAMLTRLAISSVPAWQVGVSLGLLVLTAVLAVNLSARAFRAGNLLSSAPVEWARRMGELLRQA